MIEDKLQAVNSEVISSSDLSEALKESARIIGSLVNRAVLDIGRELVKAKGLCQHGEWLTFLRVIEMQERTSQRYIKYVTMYDSEEYDHLKHLPYSRFLSEVDRETKGFSREMPITDQRAVIEDSDIGHIKGTPTSVISTLPNVDEHQSEVDPEGWGKPVTVVYPVATDDEDSIGNRNETRAVVAGSNNDDALVRALQRAEYAELELESLKRTMEILEKNDESGIVLELNRTREELRIATKRIADWQDKYNEERERREALEKRQLMAV